MSAIIAMQASETKIDNCANCGNPIEYVPTVWRVDTGTVREENPYTRSYLHVGANERCPKGTPGLVALASPIPRCPTCRSENYGATNTNYGVNFDCSDCGHHTYFSIGD